MEETVVVFQEINISVQLVIEVMVNVLELVFKTVALT